MGGGGVSYTKSVSSVHIGVLSGRCPPHGPDSTWAVICQMLRWSAGGVFGVKNPIIKYSRCGSLAQRMGYRLSQQDIGGSILSRLRVF